MSCVKKIQPFSFLMLISQAASRLRGGAVLVVLGIAGSAVAQPALTADLSQKKAVDVVLVQSKVMSDAQGKEQLVEAASVKPGDILEYTATYTNRTGKTVTGLVADLPIPEGLEYLPKTAKPGAPLVRAATKDRVFDAEPLARKVNGKSESIPYYEYRTLRWTLGQLPANGVTAVTARAKVQVVVPPAPASDKVVHTAPKSAASTVVGGMPR